MPEGSHLPAREAYRRWAPTYEAENAVTLLEQEVAGSLSPPPGGRAVDVGCGTGRRMRAVPEAVGVDLVPAMLAAGGCRGRVAAASVLALPFADAAFPLAWCRLVLGHVADLRGAYGELARILSPGGVLVVTAFHPAAVRAGHHRSFRDDRGEVVVVEQHLHEVGDHERSAADAGLLVHRRQDGEVGPEVRSEYQRAGAEDRYRRDLGLPLVLGLRMERR